MIALAAFLICLAAFHAIMAGFFIAEVSLLPDHGINISEDRLVFYIVLHMLHTGGFAIGSFYLLMH